MAIKETQMLQDVFGKDFSSLMRTIGEEFGKLDEKSKAGAMELLTEAYQVHVMYEAFHCQQNRECKIKGEHGVAEILDLHWNTVTWRLKKLGLCADDFKNANNTIELIESSPHLKELADMLATCLNGKRKTLRLRAAAMSQ